ncbi:hypothetical protein H4582DRAFT_1514372 [Lactarius indigo]|nr:hypothetical protein H4582DRAFT_1514372 [Lactarius indigo]
MSLLGTSQRNMNNFCALVRASPSGFWPNRQSLRSSRNSFTNLSTLREFVPSPLSASYGCLYAQLAGKLGRFISMVLRGQNNRLSSTCQLIWALRVVASLQQLITYSTWRVTGSSCAHRALPNLPQLLASHHSTPGACGMRHDEGASDAGSQCRRRDFGELLDYYATLQGNSVADCSKQGSLNGDYIRPYRGTSLNRHLQPGTLHFFRSVAGR